MSMKVSECRSEGEAAKRGGGRLSEEITHMDFIEERLPLLNAEFYLRIQPPDLQTAIDLCSPKENHTQENLRSFVSKCNSLSKMLVVRMHGEEQGHKNMNGGSCGGQPRRMGSPRNQRVQRKKSRFNDLVSVCEEGVWTNKAQDKNMQTSSVA